tara:strand:+ start:145 stop:294 length:150 start_codon:yes stop_codon:yes gene_type:complete
MEKTKDIPCEKCDEVKRELEEAGVWEVIGCDPILGQEGWCRIRYRLKDR